MLRPEVAYAEALLDLFNERPAAEEAAAQLADYAGALNASPQLAAFLKNPVVPLKAKKETLIKLSHGELPQLMVNFLSLLVDRSRILLLPEIHRHYRLLFAKKYNILIIKAQTAFPLDEAETTQIKTTYMEKYGAKEAWLEVKLDPKWIGGLRIQVGDRMTDNTLFGKLEGLRREINGTSMA